MSVKVDKSVVNNFGIEKRSKDLQNNTRQLGLTLNSQNKLSGNNSTTNNNSVCNLFNDKSIKYSECNEKKITSNCRRLNSNNSKINYSQYHETNTANDNVKVRFNNSNYNRTNVPPNMITKIKGGSLIDIMNIDNSNVNMYSIGSPSETNLMDKSGIYSNILMKEPIAVNKRPLDCSTCSRKQRTSTIRLTSVATSNNNKIVAATTSLPTSLIELAVNRDTRRARSEPGSLSSVVVTSPTTTSASNKSYNATRISSLNCIDSLATDVKSETTNSPTSTSNSNSNTNNNINTGPKTSVASAFASPLTSHKTPTPGNKSMTHWDNNSHDNETDYVVDPVQGNAYHKGQFLGKGGFARVYLITDIANGKKYACKIIPKNRMQKIHIQKIAREIMIHKDLNHINVVQMHHYFEDSLNVYMLLEACPKKSLMHVLKYRGKITEPEARYYMRQMVTGVAYIHSQKVVHRDLKPGNMFLSDGMIVKIGDFGLATRPDGQRRRVTICGTPNYIAPEVLYKQAYSYEADVWALGCILYALLAGQPPFDTGTLKETYSRICNNRYKKLDDTIISRTGQDLIRWLLQPTPELRPSLERVKEHPYLTLEYVPEKLAHSCCYRVPTLHDRIDNELKIQQTLVPSSFPSASSLSSSLSTSTASRRNPHLSQKELSPKVHSEHLETTITMKPKTVTTLATNKLLNVTQTQKVMKKKSKVGNWLVRKFPKLTKIRQRIGNILCPDRKKSTESATMHRALESCLAEIRYNRTLRNPLAVEGIVPLFVTKWIDYSNKYGLCFQLSDRSVGVLFNDSTKMSYTRDRRRVEYTTTDDEVTRYARERDVPSCMQKKLELLRHFTEYMDDHLTNGGEIGESATAKLSRRIAGSVPRMRRWLRTDKAIVMELTVPLLQVNFFVDHTKIIVSEGTRMRDYLVTYIDANRHATSYWLNDLRDCGCTTELYERLNYVCKASREFSHLENNAACSELDINRGTSLRA
ncbi:hypothetical protein PV328_010734 [Microctonus aethiopoides]|uniref:Serine/threonine-protein kinase PLK n=1 Tax=Microctonus aethiopoides TaxID=144406 RepID=A0AA39FIT4_9HYME|nr:hypothetical protein PV328_010734 [Microctonus aethiopoides]